MQFPYSSHPMSRRKRTSTGKGKTMARLATKTTDEATQTTLSILQDVFGSSPPFNVAVRLWDGSTREPAPEAGEPARCTLVLNHPGALRMMLVPPGVLSLGEAYIYNDFDIEGEITAILPL